MNMVGVLRLLHPHGWAQVLGCETVSTPAPLQGALRRGSVRGGGRERGPAPERGRGEGSSSGGGPPPAPPGGLPASPPGSREENTRSDPRASPGCFSLPGRGPGKVPGPSGRPALTVPAAPPWKEGASSCARPRTVAPRSEPRAAGSERAAGAAGSAGAGGGGAPSRAPGPGWLRDGAGQAAARALGRHARGEHAGRPAALRCSGARSARRSPQRLPRPQPCRADARRLPGAGSFRLQSVLWPPRRSGRGRRVRKPSPSGAWAPSKHPPLRPWGHSCGGWGGRTVPNQGW